MGGQSRIRHVTLFRRHRGDAVKGFGKYEILHELGVGGMAIVYRAHDTLLGRDVALKVINHKIKSGGAAEQRFLNEARVIAGLTHPNIVGVYDLGIESGTPYIAMEYLAGCDLRDIIDRGHPLSLDQKAAILLQIAEALDHAHSRRVIHRDVKPGNIRVLRDGKVKLMDFGIAKLATQSFSKLTQTGTVLGSVSYMSPEQIRSQDMTPAADIFSFGVVSYELLTGRLPFTGADPSAILWRISFEPPAPFTERETLFFSEDLRRLLLQCLAKERAERFETFRPFIERLSRLRSLELLSDLPDSTPPAAWVPELDPHLDREPTPISDVLPGLQMLSASLAETIRIPEPPPHAVAKPSPRAVSALFAALLGMALSAVALAVWLPRGSLERSVAPTSLAPLAAPSAPPRPRPDSAPSPRPPTPAPIASQPPPSPAPERASPPSEPSPPASATQPPAMESRLAREARQALGRVRQALSRFNASSSAEGRQELDAARQSLDAGERSLAAGRPEAALQRFDEAQRAIDSASAQDAAAQQALSHSAEEARQGALTASSAAGIARKALPAVVREADTLLRAAESDLQHGAPGAAQVGFARAASLYQESARLAGQVAQAEDLARRARYAEAWSLLDPVFRAHPDPGGDAQSLRATLDAARKRLDARLEAAHQALDHGDLGAARAAIEALSTQERDLPAVQEISGRIDTRLRTDRQPPDVQVGALDFRVETSLVVEVRVIDTSGVASVTFFAQCSGEDNFQPSAMEAAGQDLYRTVIDPKRHHGKAIKYYIEARDLAGNVRSVGSEKKPIKLKSESSLNIVIPPG
jgi:eukaryotic-like serine/threonine-protein kinase